eukprot:SAG22_NODE_1475_length_4330_cov_2.543134_1_plen_325_part_00
MLTPEQLRTFKREGAVLLPALVGEAQLASWREQAWAAISSAEGRAVDPDDPSTWPRGVFRNVPSEVQPKPRLGELPQVRALMDFLGDGAFAGGGHMLKAIFPGAWGRDEAAAHVAVGKGDAKSFEGLGTAAVRAHASAAVRAHANEGEKAAPSSLPTGDHMDGSGHHRVAITLYLSDVAEDGGAFMHWRGGHRRIHQYWLAHPDHVGEMQPGKEPFHSTPPFQERGWTAIQDLEGTVVPLGTQFVAKAGDALLWHGWSPHSSSANLRGEPRLALVARWDDAVRKYTAEGKRTFHVPARPEALFEHWGAGMRGIDDSNSTGAARL